MKKSLSFEIGSGVAREIYYTTQDIADATAIFEKHMQNKTCMLSVQNNKILDNYIKNNYQKCFKAYTSTFGDVIVLSYHHVYSLVYSITYNCMAIIKYVAVDNSGHAGWCDFDKFFNNEDMGDSYYYLDDTDINTIFAEYYARLDFFMDAINSFDNYKKRHDYTLKIMQDVINGKLSDNDLFCEDMQAV